jgi:hypothetical protein
MNENKTYVERVLWETIRKDCKYPIEDDNNGFSFGLNFIDFEVEGDIIDVEWFKTEEERENYIIENNFEVVFD